MNRKFVQNRFYIFDNGLTWVLLGDFEWWKLNGKFVPCCDGRFHPKISALRCQNVIILFELMNDWMPLVPFCTMTNSMHDELWWYFCCNRTVCGLVTYTLCQVKCLKHFTEAMPATGIPHSKYVVNAEIVTHCHHVAFSFFFYWNEHFVLDSIRWAQDNNLYKNQGRLRRQLHLYITSFRFAFDLWQPRVDNLFRFEFFLFLFVVSIVILCFVILLGHFHKIFLSRHLIVHRKIYIQMLKAFCYNRS